MYLSRKLKFACERYHRLTNCVEKHNQLIELLTKFCSYHHRGCGLYHSVADATPSGQGEVVNLTPSAMVIDRTKVKRGGGGGGEIIGPKISYL